MLDQLKQRFYARFIDGQYRRPTGLLGRYVGDGMARDHQPENQWTVACLDPQPGDRILELGFGPGGVGRDHDRRSVLVRPADHEDVVPAQSVVAGERVRRDAEPRDVADVPQPARIGPRHRHEDLPGPLGPAHGRE